MTRTTGLLITSVALAATVPLAGCEKSTQAKERPVAASTIPSAAVSSPTAIDDSLAANAEIAGDLRPIQSANLSFKVGGRLSALRVARGQHVKMGQLLASLSDAEARAMVAQAEATVKVARAQAALAEDAEKRVGQLGTAEVVSSSTVVGATLSADAARAMVVQALAAVSLARTNVANHILTAPFDGVVVMVPEGVGETVGPGNPIMRLEKLEVLVLRSTASEADLLHLSVGTEVTIKTASGKQGPGHVRAIVGSLEPISRRAPVEIEVPNRDGRFAAGSYVRALLPGVPAAATAQAPER